MAILFAAVVFGIGIAAVVTVLLWYAVTGLLKILVDIFGGR